MGSADLSNQPQISIDRVKHNSALQQKPPSSLQTTLNASVQYVIAAIIFLIYGVQVCPFLDSLETGFFVTVVISLFMAMLIIRALILKQSISLLPQTVLKKQFIIDISIFIIGGLTLAIGNYLVYQFPIGASFKVLFGFIILGFFISLVLMLQRETQLILSFDNTKSMPFEKQLPFADKIKLFTLSLLIGPIVTMMMLIYKDLEWLQNIGEDISLDQASLWILYEFLFVAVIFISYGLYIIRHFSNNVSLYFNHQNSVLAAVKSGQRNIKVPIVSNDEFGLMAQYTNHMIASLNSSEQTLKQTRDATIFAISSLAETRDNETGAHILRTQEYVKALGIHLQKNDRFKDELTDEKLELIYKSAPLHDIGKVGIPDAILLKPGKLTDEEFEVMKTHPLIGSQAIEKAEEQTGSIPFLHYAKEISQTHHEKWNGSGYPYGLKGTDIPLSGRLMALADVYDALITKRVYKPAFSHEKSKAIILEGRSTHFDPVIVDAFLAIENEFVGIAQRYKDQ